MAEFEGFINEDVSPGEPIVSDDPVCQMPGCNEPLTYSGRGRKPKYCEEHKGARTVPPSSPGRAGNKVESALSALSLLNGTIGMVFVFIDPTAKALWQAAEPELTARNREILNANPKLVEQITKSTAKAGPGALVASYAAAMMPALAMGYASSRAKAAKPTPNRMPPPASPGAQQSYPRPVSVEDDIDERLSRR